MSARVPAPDVAPRGKKRSAYATKWFVAALLPLAFTIAGSRVKAVALTGSAAVFFFFFKTENPSGFGDRKMVF